MWGTASMGISRGWRTGAAKRILPTSSLGWGSRSISSASLMWKAIYMALIFVGFLSDHLYPFSISSAGCSGQGTLDYGLKAQAIEAGVKFRFRSRKERLPDRGIIAIGPKVADAIAKGLIFETGLPGMAAVIWDDSLAPKGYAYLLVHEGQATLATVLFRHYRDERYYFNRTLETFQRLYPFQMKSPREFGGFGNFSIRPTAYHGGKLYVGEAAGFQDYLFGFGMRYAMSSGYLAAWSIIEGIDYDKLWKKELLPSLRATMVNRLTFEFIGNRGYKFLARRISRTRDVRGWMQWFCRPSISKSFLYPFAALMGRYRLHFKDYSCSHEDCDCVWCRCQRE